MLAKSLLPSIRICNLFLVRRVRSRIAIAASAPKGGIIKRAPANVNGPMDSAAAEPPTVQSSNLKRKAEGQQQQQQQSAGKKKAMDPVKARVRLIRGFHATRA